MTLLAAFTLPDWQRAGGQSLPGAILRRSPQDFRVTELLQLDFTGDGEHEWLWLRKTGANTAWVARQLARFAGIPVRDVGYSGLKDRHAVTTQWFSVRRARDSEHDWDALRIDGVEILRVERHSRKLRTGTHRRNAFEIRLAECTQACPESLHRIGSDGVPNYFGEQRFGRDAGNLALADALIGGRRLKREQRSMALSAARSYLFNAVLDARVRAGNWNRLLDGDIAMLAGSGSHFAVEKVDATLEQRLAEFDVHPSGPLWGRGGPVAAAAEQQVLSQHAELAAALERLADSARRSLRLQVHELAWEQSGTDLRLAFELERGAYATAVLRELVRYRDASTSP